MNGPTLFAPEHAIIIRNKAEAIIPLLLTTIPTPKEFQDAIESLSPEQQAFAKSFRAMQLESTLFAVCILQIKPQLERLLNLPVDALTKEIELSERILSLFMTYQIPSDQLSFDGEPDTHLDEKLARVRDNVAKIESIVSSLKQEQLRELEQAYAAEELRRQTLARQQSRPKPQADLLDEVKSGRRLQRVMPQNDRSRSIEKDYKMKESKQDKGSFKKKRMVKKDSGPVSAKDTWGGDFVPSEECAPVATSGTVDLPAAAVAEPSPSGGETTVEPPEPAAEDKQPDLSAAISGGPDQAFDFTAIPQQLDDAFLQLDEDAALRPTILNVAPEWSFRSQASVLAAPTTETLGAPALLKARNEAFDLIDSLSRSGNLPFLDGSLHVVVAATHVFDKSIIDTVVQDNVNPVDKLERSLLIVASIVHGQPLSAVVAPGELRRITNTHPRLFASSSK
jgi:hypothetical protein